MRPSGLAIAVITTLALSTLGFEAMAAPRAYMVASGAKQGRLKGESAGFGQLGLIEVEELKFDLVSPRDPVSGLPVGNLQHKPVMITKLLDSVSPQLLRAMTSNENFTTVTIDLVRAGAGGREVPWYEIRLVNASISSIHQYMDRPGSTPVGTPERRELEDISFVYQRLEVEHLITRTTATDDWRGQQ